MAKDLMFCVPLEISLTLFMQNSIVNIVEEMLRASHLFDFVHRILINYVN